MFHIDENLNMRFHGKLSSVQHVLMLESLRKCYDKKLSVETTFKKIGTSLPAIKKYFQEWEKQDREGRDYAYFFQHEKAKERAIRHLFRDVNRLKIRNRRMFERLDSLNSYGVILI